MGKLFPRHAQTTVPHDPGPCPEISGLGRGGERTGIFWEGLPLPSSLPTEVISFRLVMGMQGSHPPPLQMSFKLDGLQSHSALAWSLTHPVLSLGT
jgi:hypothetical protein